jgi:hypothetical protein
MKIILSRKGFDSASGGMPSPIFPDGKMISLPIPTSSESPLTTKISDLRVNGYDIAKVISDLSGNRLTHEQFVHLDPDINHEMLANRPKDWCGAFGQVDKAQSHLANNAINKGDLFIYFGWFREIEHQNQVWQFKPNAPNLHAIYGWLFVEDIVPIYCNKENVLKNYPWLEYHPHLLGKCNHKNETIYVGSQKLPAEINTNKSGYGVFSNICDKQTLTDTRQNNRSVWRLPASFYPSEEKTALTYHQKIAKWKIENDDWVVLSSVGRGQEFILDTKCYPDINKWLVELFSS